jgi:hypothetical protein
MSRVYQWERALVAEVRRHSALPFSWGVSNCFYMTMDCVRAVTGTDPWVDARGCDSEAWYKRWLARNRFGNVGDAFARRMAEIPSAQMGRGDIAVVEQDGMAPGVVCLGPTVVGKVPMGTLQLPRSRVVRAFRVG